MGMVILTRRGLWDLGETPRRHFITAHAPPHRWKQGANDYIGIYEVDAELY